jgi:hypothetical protein
MKDRVNLFTLTPDRRRSRPLQHRDEDSQSPQTFTIQHDLRQLTSLGREHVGHVSSHRARTPVRQHHDQQQHTPPPLEPRRGQQLAEQRMDRRRHPHPARQHRPKMLQSVAIPPGTGKSHLATALAAEACARGYKVRFFRATELVTTLIEARDERTFLRLKTQLAKLDLLVLDELGYVPATKVGAELLFDVIATAYERTSMIVTTNLPFESWTEVLGSERLTGATLDRLTHRCRIIETKGESYRLHDAKTRRRSPRTTNQLTDPTTAQAD